MDTAHLLERMVETVNPMMTSEPLTQITGKEKGQVEQMVTIR